MAQQNIVEETQDLNFETMRKVSHQYFAFLNIQNRHNMHYRQLPLYTWRNALTASSNANVPGVLFSSILPSNFPYYNQNSIWLQKISV